MILHVRSDSIKCILVEAGHKRGTESWSSLYIAWFCILTFSSYLEVLHLVNKFSLLIAQAAPLTSVRTINKIKGRGGARRSRKKSWSIKTTWIGSMHRCCSGGCKDKLQCLLLMTRSLCSQQVREEQSSANRSNPRSLHPCSCILQTQEETLSDCMTNISQTAENKYVKFNQFIIHAICAKLDYLKMSSLQYLEGLSLHLWKQRRLSRTATTTRI